MLKDVTATSGLNVLSMYVRAFGYGKSTVEEMKGPTDTFATMWAVTMLNFLGLSDVILQCDPEPLLIKWAESVKSKRSYRTVIRMSPRRSHQSNGGVEHFSATVAGTGAYNVGGNARAHTMQTNRRQRPYEMDRSTRSLAHSSFPRKRCVVPVLSCHGRTVSRKTGGVWRNSSCTSSRGWKGIWKSRTGVGRQMEIWRVAWARATSRTSTFSEQTMELYMLEVYDDSQSTAGQKRTSSQSSRPHRSRGRRQPMMQQIPEQYQKYMNTRTRMKKRTTTMVRTKNHPTSQTTRIMTLRERRFWSPTQLRR